MASPSLLTEVEAALSLSLDLGYTSKAMNHDLYEAYVLTLLLRAADAAGWGLEMRNGWGHAVTAPVFRLGPGRITSRDYTFVRMTKAGRAPLEAHLGVKVAGKAKTVVSGATKSGHLLHEFDLVLLPESVGTACRAAGGDPDYTTVIMHAEMKFYTGKLSLPLGRAAVGMAFECGLSGKSVLVTNQLGYTVQDLVDHHGIGFRYNVLPSNKTVEGFVMQWFSRFL